MPKTKLLPQQISELKRQYLQQDNAALAALIGVSEKAVKAELKSLGLVRSKWTEKKLASSQKRDLLAPDVTESNDIEVDFENVSNAVNDSEE